jgi:WD40 repeat protein
VRELFRNLVTSQGTRANREVEELLSIFPKEEERKAAEEVLRELVAARLLTSYEDSIEIIHESLLSAWPRLVQWRNQDEGGALFRDQLRQAAQAWQDRGRPDDLLWTGTSYREFSVWRERYTGGLSATEEEFARSATRLAGRRRRRRRAAVAAVIAVLLGGMTVVTSLWRRSVLEVSRREAAQILALGRVELEERPTAALAHALASLERADSDEARRFAVEALWHGAAAIVLAGNVNTADFSPDGRWLVTGGFMSGVQLWSRDGSPPKILGEPDPKGNFSVQFNPEGDILAAGGETARFWSVPEGKEIGAFDLDGRTRFFRRGSHLLSSSRTDTAIVIRDWSVFDRDPGVLASLDQNGVSDWDLDSSGEWFLSGRDRSVYVSRLRESPNGSRLVGRHDANVVWIASDPARPLVLSGDESGEVRIWSFSEDSSHLDRVFRAPEPSALIDPTGSWVTVSGESTPGATYIWDLKGPPDAEPLVLRNRDLTVSTGRAYHPDGLWLVSANNNSGAGLWPLHPKYPHVLHTRSSFPTTSFTPDGKSLVAAWQSDALRLWPLSPGAGDAPRILMEGEAAEEDLMHAVDPVGRYVLVSSANNPRVLLVPLAGGKPRQMPGYEHEKDWLNAFAFSPDGRLAAAGGRRAVIRVWDLETGELRLIDLRQDREHCWGEAVPDAYDLAFLTNRELLTSDAWGIRLWNLDDGTSRDVRPCRQKTFTHVRASPKGRRLLVVDVELQKGLSTFGLYDLESKTFREITSHGNRVFAATLDPTGTMVVTGDFDGVVRAGPVTGEEPHLLYADSLQIVSVAVSPDGRWISSSSQGGTIRIWPMPEGTPFHTLPYAEILERIRSMTNLRVVPDESSGTGYRVEIGPFPGWKNLPTW